MIGVEAISGFVAILGGAPDISDAVRAYGSDRQGIGIESYLF